jgi:hypothetical protein
VRQSPRHRSFLTCYRQAVLEVKAARGGLFTMRVACKVVCEAELSAGHGRQGLNGRGVYIRVCR